MARKWLLVALAAVVLVMAVIDQHPAASGRSVSLWTTAAYPKVYVHAVGGLALAALVAPIVRTIVQMIGFVTALGFAYEAIQWRGGSGVFTLAEALAVMVGALFFASWYAVLVWSEIGDRGET
jgi:hypothetical protein